MAPSAGCSLQETCKDERLTSWQSLRLKAVVLMLVCLPVAAARLPAVKPGLAGEGYYSKAKAGGNGRVVGARNYIETAEMMAHGTPVMSATICRGSSSALKGVLGQPTADKGTDVEHNPSPHQAAVGSRASPSQQPTIPAAQFTLCPAKTSDRHTQTGGGVSQQHNKPADLSYELPELVEGRSLIDLPWGEEVLVGSDHDAGKVASASFSFFEWSRRKLLNRQMELQRLHTDSETRMLDEVDISPILRLTHRAKTERQLPDSPAHNPSPPGPGSPFSSLDHEHLLAADAARRALISSSKIALGGSTVPLGYYFAEIALGTPPQRFQMIVDTGSAIMYVPAKECVSCGGTHEVCTPIPTLILMITIVQLSSF